MGLGLGIAIAFLLNIIIGWIPIADPIIAGFVGGI